MLITSEYARYQVHGRALSRLRSSGVWTLSVVTDGDYRTRHDVETILLT